ncbi:MAG TPA: alpha-E domain-containing protein [Saprospiraceae bacterium]|nr:alpha-E domain-containing protein [Saprospiraceae bacterium]HPG07385.1 alpha-E domain-containing protein [Saprospiraceae bacterium]HPQ99714.1 alpha-E domain-containing protein [Saprospiraceae bacterium]HQU52136.1 alpha-E domain-containing protein [Saprospiraceae bacterium]HRV86467.1 alpha-E domain-containing protein [Saprospiraceae bacterium]
MLSRVANHLYWMGRYLERTDHLARYINVEYFGSLDSPEPRQHLIALKSIIDMTGMPPVEDHDINEEEVLITAALDDKNPVSIISSLYACRENARSARESLSKELWEAINNFYIFVSGYPVDVYKTRGLFDFTTHVMQHCANVRGRIMFTLMHDISWQFIQMGLLIERSAQIVRIMISKLNDIEELKKLKLGQYMEAQQYNILLDCVEAKDMCHKYYSNWPERHATVDFLLFNPYFPKSVVRSMLKLKLSLEKIQSNGLITQKDIAFQVGKLISPLEYVEFSDIEGDLEKFLEDTLSKIYLISDLIVKKYFT